jgi:hypothetical protein
VEESGTGFGADFEMPITKGFRKRKKRGKEKMSHCSHCKVSQTLIRAGDDDLLISNQSSVADN